MSAHEDLPRTTALDLELADKWLCVWFNEPEKRNPLTTARIAALRDLCAALEHRRDIRGVVFRGRGGIFCAGGDLKSFGSLFSNGGADRDAVMAASTDAGRVLDAINRLPQVTVMAVEGAAMAGGFGLACVGDVVIADRAAKFALTETMIGLSPAQIAPFILQRLGQREGRKHMLLAATLDSETAHRIGLVDTLVDDAAGIDDALMALRDTTRRCAPGAVAETKRLILTLPGLDRAVQLDAAAGVFADRILSDEGREGIASFLEKRKPEWADRS